MVFIYHNVIIPAAVVQLRAFHNCCCSATLLFFIAIVFAKRTGIARAYCRAIPVE